MAKSKKTNKKAVFKAVRRPLAAGDLVLVAGMAISGAINVCKVALQQF